MQMTSRAISLLASLGFALACNSAPPVASPAASSTGAPSATSTSEKGPTAPVVGGDRDAHGCIGSAGYQWCAFTNQCERSWELASKAGFANTQEGFSTYCAQTRK